MTRRTILFLLLTCSIALALLTPFGSGATQAPPPPKARGTVQINSSSPFNEKACWSGGPIELCVPVYSCPFGGPQVGVLICVSVTTNTKKPKEIATDLANAINANAVCAAGGVSAKAVNDTVLITGNCGPVTNGTSDAPGYTGATTGTSPNVEPNYNKLSATYFARN